MNVFYMLRSKNIVYDRTIKQRETLRYSNLINSNSEIFNICKKNFDIIMNRETSASLIESQNLLQDTDKSENSASRLEKCSGLVSMLAYVLLVVTCSACVQKLERAIPDFELNTIRYTLSVLVFSLRNIIKREWPTVPRSEIAITIAYGCATFSGSVTTFIAVTFVPLATVKLKESCFIPLILKMKSGWTTRITPNLHRIPNAKFLKESLSASMARFSLKL